MTREEAIIDLNALKFILDNDQYTDEIEEALDMAISALQQPERQRGRWIDTGSGQECSECHEIQYGYDSFRYFCAFCGADMRGEQNE